MIRAQPPLVALVQVGYTRVSTVAQTLEQQNAALAAAGVTKTFSDTMSDGTGLVRQACRKADF
jgi:DNA invertase Pin-like site-specific DNA recombinase